MALSEGVESALHLCVLLAGTPGHAVPAAQLAEFHALAPAATAKLLQQLAAAGVVEARPGRSGGYALARDPREITVSEIVAASGAAGGPGVGFHCREIRRQGPCAGDEAAYSPRCAIAALMDKAELEWWKVLGDETLHALATRVRAGVDDSIRATSQAWLRAAARPR